VLATISGSSQQIDTSVGAVLGSALLAFTLIPAVCVVFAPNSTLELTSGVLIRDISFFCATLVVLSVVTRDGQASAAESAILMLIYVPYLYALLRWSHHPDAAPGQSLEEQVLELEYGTVSRPPAQSQVSNSASDDAEHEEWVPGWFKALLPPYSMDPAAQFGKVLFVSIVFISGISEACLQVSSLLADSMGVTHHWTGFVLVGLGAQVEDLFASVTLARKGKASSAIAAIVGSQVLNISVGVGLPFFLSSAMSGNPMVVHESALSSLVVFFVVLLFSLLCFKHAPSRSAALVIWDVPLMVLAYFGAIVAVFRTP
jgi:sodium/potassium/calcium exchanger 5